MHVCLNSDRVVSVGVSAANSIIVIIISIGIIIIIVPIFAGWADVVCCPCDRGRAWAGG